MNPTTRWLSLLLFAAALAVSQIAAAADNFNRQDITFTSVGKKLVGWLYVPNGMLSLGSGLNTVRLDRFLP